MKLQRVQIKNFRLLRKVELNLEDQTTLIVGRNNSGKTSLCEVVRLFTSDHQPAFSIQDFSIGCYDDFLEAFKALNEGKKTEVIRELLPYIELRMFFTYDFANPSSRFPGEFVVDLDMDCLEALVVMRFELSEGTIERLFEDQNIGDTASDKEREDFFRTLGERIPKLYKINVWAEDPNDAQNRKPCSQAMVKSLQKINFIDAHRGLTDVTTKESNVLAKILEVIFSTATLESADQEEQEIVRRLEQAVRKIQENIDGDFKTQLENLLPTLETIGYPGLGDPELTTETTLDVGRLLKDHTKVRYKGHKGIMLPESYNGLGMRNLIYILLRILSFHRDFRFQAQPPGVHLIFIEEPEVHMHPQMQEVFIRQLGKIVKGLNEKNTEKPSWPVQFVISTHSSHIANEAKFDSVRYFLRSRVSPDKTIWETRVKDLSKDFSISPEDTEFLHKYLTLTKCDLFFADAAILIEGTSERLLLPKMIQKLDDPSEGETKLLSRYVAIMEVGGAYAHKFADLLNFLELRSLIVTDLDPVTGNGGKKCLVHKAKGTSNSCIKWFFGDDSCAPVELIKKPESALVKGHIRIAYQCPETAEGPCGRTLEDAFILKNARKFNLKDNTAEQLEERAWEKAKILKKSDFALQYAIYEDEWEPPKYITEGLKWLACGFQGETGHPGGTVTTDKEAENE